jgi:hypothetical protein
VMLMSGVKTARFLREKILLSESCRVAELLRHFLAPMKCMSLSQLDEILHLFDDADDAGDADDCSNILLRRKASRSGCS